MKMRYFIMLSVKIQSYRLISQVVKFYGIKVHWEAYSHEILVVVMLLTHGFYHSRYSHFCYHAFYGYHENDIIYWCWNIIVCAHKLNAASRLLPANEPLPLTTTQNVCGWQPSLWRPACGTACFQPQFTEAARRKWCFSGKASLTM